MTSAVILCTYNGQRHLSEQICSLWEQTKQPDAIYIRDDGSRDGTVALLESLMAKSPVPMYLTRGSHRGVNGGFYELLMQTTEEMVFFCDQDDVWDRRKIEVMMDAASRLPQWHTHPCLIHSEARLMDEGGMPLAETLSHRIGKRGKTPDFFDLLGHNVVQGCACAVSGAMRSWQTRPWNEWFPHCYYDQWLALTACRFGAVRFVPEPLLRYRQHGGNAVGGGAADGYEKNNLVRSYRRGLEFYHVYRHRLSLPRQRAYRFWLKHGWNLQGMLSLIGSPRRLALWMMVGKKDV